MADLSVNFAGIKSPNPFWLASAQPTNERSRSKTGGATGGPGRRIMRAFEYERRREARP